jgi:hypothetical protein
MPTFQIPPAPAVDSVHSRSIGFWFGHEFSIHHTGICIDCILSHVVAKVIASEIIAFLGVLIVVSGRSVPITSNVII